MVVVASVNASEPIKLIVSDYILLTMIYPIQFYWQLFVSYFIKLLVSFQPIQISLSASTSVKPCASILSFPSNFFLGSPWGRNHKHLSVFFRLKIKNLWLLKYTFFAIHNFYVMNFGGKYAINTFPIHANFWNSRHIFSLIIKMCFF